MKAEDRRLLELLIDPLRAPEARQRPVAESVARASREPTERVVAMLEGQRISQLWLEAAGGPRALPEALGLRLGELRALAVARRALRERMLERALRVLDGEGIRCVVFKGEHLARVLYPKPLLRTCSDADLLVAREEREAAIRALVRDGFAGALQEKSASHEVAMMLPGANLDLHWDFFRPGRVRTDLAAWILEGRVVEDGRPHPSKAATLVLMLFHSALTEHLTARMSPALDLDRWVRQQPTPWDEACEVLAAAGLRTAAWVTLRWVRTWLGTPIPARVVARLAPGPLRRAYLAHWLDRGPARVYRSHRQLVRMGFGLPLHDSPQDAWNATRAWMAARRRIPDEVRALESAFAG